MPRRLRLRRQHRRHPRSRQRLHRAVIQHPRRMHHRPQIADRRQHLRQRSPIGHITRHHRHLGTSHLQLGHQLRRTVGGHPPPTDQHQTLHPMRHDQMPCHQRAQPTRTTSDQHGALTRPHRLPHRHPGPHQPRHRHHTTTHHQLRLTHTNQPRHLKIVGIHQHEPARMLRLRRPHQPPQRRPRRHVLRRQHRQHTLTLNQPPLHHLQPLAHHVSHRPTGNLRPVRLQTLDRLTRHHRLPLHGVQRVDRGGLLQLLRRHRPRHQRPHRPDRCALAVGQCHGHAVVASQAQPDAQEVRAGGSESHVVPGERQRHRAVGAGRHECGLQGRVEQYGVDAVAPGLPVQRFGKLHLGQQVVAVTPHAPQTLERRAVLVAVPGQPLVRLPQRHLHRTRRRPHLTQHRTGSRIAGRQHTRRVLRPDRIRIAVIPSEDLQLAITRPGRLTHRDLHLHGTALRQHQRRLQHQLPYHRRAHLGAGMQRQLGPDSARYDHRIKNDVLGEPRHCPGRPPAGPHRAVLAGEADPGAHQRMLFRRARLLLVGRQPVTLALERVRRQVDPSPRHALEDGRPVDVHAPGEQLTGGGEHPPQPALIASQGFDGGRRQRLLDDRREHRVRAHLQEQVRSGLFDGLLEPYGLAQIAEPVGRVHRRGVDRFPGDGRDQGDRGRGRRDAGQLGQQPVADLFHLR